MTDLRGFAEWEGQPVKVSYPSGVSPSTDYGILAEVMEWGIVLNHSATIQLRKNARVSSQDDQENSTGVGRQVSEFLPWHRINSIRLLEPDEKEAYGL
jgi:hypothetical protein